jgi:phage terminase small subunit
MALTNKQKAFIDEYLVDFNATQAAIRAGYSEKSAYSIGWENLRKPEIIEAIREKAMSAEEVLMRLSDIARGDIADLMNITPAGFTFRLLVDENGERVVNPNTKLIRKIKQKVTTYLGKTEDAEDREIIETEIELYNAQDALVQLGKYHKLFVDRTETTGADGGPIAVRMIEVTLPAEDGPDDD